MRLLVPNEEKYNNYDFGNGLSYSISSMQGYCPHMEDKHHIVLSLPGQLKDWNYFALFDGHTGASASEYASQHLLDNVIQSWVFPVNNSSNKEVPVETVKTSIINGFLKLDEKMKSDLKDYSGTTAVSILVSKTHFYFSNCGDSRVLLFRDNKVVFSSKDHKPSDESEERRIREAGGEVLRGRVKGRLALSRSLGDFWYKQNFEKGPCDQMVSPLPDVTVFERSKMDEFIILATDGVWDVMKNEDLCNNIKFIMQTTKDLQDICNQIVFACLKKGSRDNISIILIALPASLTKATRAFEMSHIFAVDASLVEDLINVLYINKDLKRIFLEILDPALKTIFQELKGFSEKLTDNLRCQVLEKISETLKIIVEDDNPPGYNFDAFSFGFKYPSSNPTKAVKYVIRTQLISFLINSKLEIFNRLMKVIRCYSSYIEQTQKLPKSGFFFIYSQVEKAVWYIVKEILLREVIDGQKKREHFFEVKDFHIQDFPFSEPSPILPDTWKTILNLSEKCQEHFLFSPPWYDTTFKWTKSGNITVNTSFIPLEVTSKKVKADSELEAEACKKLKLSIPETIPLIEQNIQDI